MEPSSSDRRIDRVILACTQCRGRHVKCDATQPACNRCRRDGKECTYQKSRRGGLDKAALAARRLKLQKQQEQEHEQERSESQKSDDTGPSSSKGSSTSPNSERDNYHPLHNFQALNIANPTFDGPSTVSFAISSDRLLDLYYEHFFPAYPYTLPQHFLALRGNHGLDDLLLAMKFIGSVYAPWTPTEPFYETAFATLCRPDLPRTGFSVQALLMFATAQHHLDHRPEARMVLDLAIEIGLELQINSRDFARLYGENNMVLEESWRRTFYFLLLTDQHFSVVVNNPTFAMRDAPNHVDLPCDDEFYESGQIPPPATLEEYDLREFAEIEVIYSSMAYMYDIGRVVSHISRLWPRHFTRNPAYKVVRSFISAGSFTDSLVTSADAKIAIWQSMLPACKRDPMRPDGSVDEVMFMAHMSCSVLIMSLHRPMSSLAYSIEELSAPSFVSPVPFLDPPKYNRSAHTARALRAAEMQTKLLAIPCATEHHNLFTLCISATLAAAQISACNVLLEDHALAIARDRVRLSIGYLSQMGTIWPLAKQMAKDVRYVARSTLSGTARVTHTATTELDSSAEIEIPRDELIWPINPSAQIDIYSGLTLPEWDPSLSMAHPPPSDIP